MNFFLLLNPKEDILKNGRNQTVDVPVEWEKIQWKSMGSINCLVSDILQNKEIKEK